MANVANFKRQIRSSRTRINTIVVPIMANVYQIDAALVGEQRTEAIRNQLAAAQSDADKVRRVMNTLQEWQQKYINLVDQLHDDEAQQGEEDLENFLTDENIEDAENRGRDAFDHAHAHVNRLNGLLAAVAPVVVPPAILPAAGGRRRGIKLPDRDVPKFWGQPEKWLTWLDSYRYAIHENPDLANIDRFHYLMDVLRGPAKKMLIGMMITDDNYAVAIRMLNERFGGNSQIITSLHQSLKNLPRTREGFEDFKKLVENIQIITAQLTRMGDNVNQTSTEVSIMEKLPEWAALKVLETKEITPVADWNTTALIKKLTDMVALRTQAKSFAGEKQQHPKSTNYRNYGAHAAINDTSNELKSKKCLLCGGEHWSSRCQKHQTFGERAKHILELNRCFKCLSGRS